MGATCIYVLAYTRRTFFTQTPTFQTPSKSNLLAVDLKKQPNFYVICKVGDPEADFPEIAPLPNLPIDRQGFSGVVTDADHVLRRHLLLMDRVPGAAGYILSIMSKRWSCLWRIAISRATLRPETCKPKSSNRTRRTPAEGLPESICQRLSTAAQRVSSSSVDRSSAIRA